MKIRLLASHKKYDRTTLLTQAPKAVSVSDAYPNPPEPLVRVYVKVRLTPERPAHPGSLRRTAVLKERTNEQADSHIPHPVGGMRYGLPHGDRC